MSKIRVYELAKELTSPGRKVASKEIIEKAQTMGIIVDNHLSQLEETEAARLKKAIVEARATATGTETRVRRTVIRRRRKGTDAPIGEPEEVQATEPAEAVVEPPAEEPPEAAEPEAIEEPAEQEEAAEAEPEEAPEVEAEAPEAEEPAEGEEEAPPEEEEAEAAEEPAAEAPEEKVAEEEKPAEEKKPEPLVPTRKKKPAKDAYKAVVVSMPEPEEVEALARAKPAARPSSRDLDKEEKASGPRRKGKKLIYDRRRAGVGGRYGDRDGGRRGAKRKKASRKVSEQETIEAAAQVRTIRIEETITVGELAGQMTIKANILLRKLVEQGIMATLNDTLDYDTAAIIATDLGYEVENVAFDIDQYLEAETAEEQPLASRPPVVTIMGHVDHGKTSLLDFIQRSRIAEGEAGGITQTIGAYVVERDKGKIVFVDTPGHEAFTAMRARGAMVTDIVILVVAADDGVMPQTVEAINHAKAAGVPILVAVNKTDKPDADPEKVRRELSNHELVAEEWGGDTTCINLSAKTGEGVDNLLEMLLLQADLLELKADPSKRAKGTIIESRLEKGRGPVATVIIQEGTLTVGDIVVAGPASGRVRALVDHRGKPMKSVGPSFPAEIAGLDRVAQASELMYAVVDEKASKVVTDHLSRKERDERLAKQKKPTFDQLFSQLGEDEAKVLKVVLKADTQGAVEAIRQGMEQLTTEKVILEVIHEGVGVISENDVNLTQASDGLVLGFNVKPDAKAKGVADQNGVQILTFNLIHELLDKTVALMEGKLDLIEEETYLGRAEVRQVFGISKVGKVAGCYVQDGKILRSALARLIRAEEIVWHGRLSSLKRFKDDVKEVAQGFECGMSLENFDKMREGDIIEAYEINQVAATL